MTVINPAFARLGDENAFAVLAKAAELQRQGRDIINLGIGQPDFKTPPHIVEAAVKALRDGEHGYTDATGIAPLREAVSDDLAPPARRRRLAGPRPDHAWRQGRHVHGDPDVRRGGDGDRLSRSRIPDLPFDDRVHRRDPRAGADARRERLRLLGRGDAEPDHAETRLLIVNSPANPTGGVTPPEAIDRLVAGLADFPDVAILSDEIYGQLTYDGLAHRSLLTYPEIRDRLILLDGWSKTYAMTGWRLGYSVWPKPMA